MKALRLHAGGQTLEISEDQTRWLAEELRSHPPPGMAGPAGSVAATLERAMEEPSSDEQVALQPDESTALLEFLWSDRIAGAPGPSTDLRDLRNALFREVGGRF